MPSLFSNFLNLFGPHSKRRQDGMGRMERDDYDNEKEDRALPEVIGVADDEIPADMLDRSPSQYNAPKVDKNNKSRRVRPRVSDGIKQNAMDVRTMKKVELIMDGLGYHSGGVFSNVYRGVLMSPERVEVAVKKTWPKKGHRNDEFFFLAGMRRNAPENIIKLLYTFKNAHDTSICEAFVFAFMPDTLDNVIRRESLDIIDIKLYTWQLFNGLYFLALNKIVHRDVKPVNILVKHKTGELQIGDFGSAKVIHEGDRSSAYQVTRYYRPPELLLGSMNYDWRVDVWSAGCVMGEMLGGRVLFCGRDSKDQMRLVMDAMGSPTIDDLREMNLHPDQGNSRVRRQGFTRLLKKAPREAITMVKRILVYSPQDRLCNNEMLNDTFYDDIRSPETVRHNGQHTMGLMRKQKGPATRAYPFKELIASNKGKNTPDIPSPDQQSEETQTMEGDEATLRRRDVEI